MCKDACGRQALGFSEGKHHHHLGACLKCKFTGPTPDLLNQKLEVDPNVVCFYQSCGPF